MKESFVWQRKAVNSASYRMLPVGRLIKSRFFEFLRPNITTRERPSEFSSVCTFGRFRPDSRVPNENNACVKFENRPHLVIWPVN